MKQNEVKLNSITFSNNKPFVLLGGPCVIESEKLVFQVATRLKEITSALKIPDVFKSSYDKSNRSSVKSFRGPGLREGLKILSKVKEKLDLPIITDIHTPEEAREVARVADILQIPAFLCRQSDLLISAGETGKIVNIKKGQFMSPWEMKNVIEKVESTGNKRIFVTERGTTFGYNNLVVDMRGLDIMKSFQYPVVYDATHSVQLPGGKGNSSGGQREFVLPLARAATALGLAALFMEIHPDPDHALSDGPNSLKLSNMKNILEVLLKLDKVVKTA
ncbi:MAG: 3-deoxy-8-phosphooctulonate synthase [Elusimicrobiota bacterium]